MADTEELIAGVADVHIVEEKTQVEEVAMGDNVVIEEVIIYETEVIEGESEVAAGEPVVAAGEPEVAAGEPEVAGGEPEDVGGESVETKQPNGVIPTAAPPVYDDAVLTPAEIEVPSLPAVDPSLPQADGIACTLSPAADYWTTDRHSAVKVRFSGIKGHVTNEPAISVMELLDQSSKKYSSRTAMKVERDGEWKSWTYGEYVDEIKTAAKAFIKLGLEPCHGVGIIGFNSPEWLFADVGAIYAGGFACGIYTTNNVDACQYVCADAGCNIGVAENDAQLQKMLQIWDKVPTLKALVQYTGELKEKRENVYTWSEFMAIGKEESDEELKKRMQGQAPNRCCTLIYTSGTTGNPKGVMVSHDNIVSVLKSLISQMAPLIDPDSDFQEQCISYLPLSHIAAQLTDIWIPIFAGACVWFARPDALKGSLGDTLRAARPTLFVGVPRVFEKIEEKLKGMGAQIHGIKRRIGTWAKGVALQGNTNMEFGQPVPYGWTVATYFLGKIRKGLGLDRAKLIFTAAAPISKSTLQYFQSINVPLLELYGMSEGTGPMTISMPGKSRITSIGKILTINEGKILNPDEDGSGEICVRGRNVFMGYLNNPDKTQESLDEEGWLHSGDVGKIDEDGFYFITGRIKEIIITAGGENVAPVPIEDNIKLECPLISTAMVIGDRKKFLSCLLTCKVQMDLETGMPTDELLPIAQQYCNTLGLKVTKASEIAPDVPELLKTAIQEGIDRANKKAVSNSAKVQKWKLLPLEFTTANGELGPTQKLRRPHVMKMYKELVDEFYAC